MNNEDWPRFPGEEELSDEEIVGRWLIAMVDVVKETSKLKPVKHPIHEEKRPSNNQSDKIHNKTNISETV